MGTESIEASFLSIFALISFFIFLIVSKYSHKIRDGALLDKDFLKPQAFHDAPITRSGGVAAIISLSVFFVIYYLLYSKILYNYIFISYSMFLVGFLDDLKIDVKPFARLVIMVLLLFLLIYNLPIKIFNIEIPFLIPFMSSHILSSMFVLLCFLFVINGANLIDGFNGLLTINLIPQVGDILLFRNNFYEVDGKIENQLIMGRDPDYAISTETTDHGDSFSILINTHISRVEKLNLIPLREGKYPTTTKVDGGIANLIG